jgi:FtsH-binding integral membrane protein
MELVRLGFVAKHGASRLLLCSGKAPPSLTFLRLIGQESRAGVGRRLGRRNLKEVTAEVGQAVSAPAGETAFNIGKGVAAGAGVFGLGALCYYGLGLSSEAGIVERSYMWPQHVKDRIHTTYLYVGGSVAATAASAAAVLRSPTMMRLVTRNSWVALGASIAAMIGTGMVAHSLPYTPGFGTKQLAWLTHCGVMGALIAPLAFFGGTVLIRAAWYTAGIIGGLSTVAVCAPSEKFLNMAGPLAIGFGVVFAASIGSFFLPPTTALGAGLYSVALYGGLVLFSAFLLYDTQAIIKHAETYPAYGVQGRQFDPISSAMRIYIDTLNIFVRMVQILGGGGRRK